MNEESEQLLQTINRIRSLVTLDIFLLLFIPEEFLAFLDNLLVNQGRILNLYSDFIDENFVTNVNLINEPLNDFVLHEDRCNHYRKI